MRKYFLILFISATVTDTMDLVRYVTYSRNCGRGETHSFVGRKDHEAIDTDTAQANMSVPGGKIVFMKG